MTSFVVSHKEALSIKVAIDAVKVDLSEVLYEISKYKGKRIPMRLSLRKAQLKSLLSTLETRKSSGIKKIYKKDVGFEFIMALVAMLIANKARLEAKNAALTTQFSDSNDAELEKYFKNLLKNKPEARLVA